MTDASPQPTWLQGYEPKPAKWEKGMASPNPAGRPKGGAVEARQDRAGAER
jgi:hypothetical protein